MIIEFKDYPDFYGRVLGQLQAHLIDNHATLNWSIELKKAVMNRTLSQNAAFHLYFTLLGNTLNDSGLDMRKFLKPSIDIPWTPEAVKTHVWKPIQFSMFETNSTTELSTNEVTKVYDVLNRHLVDKFSVSVPFPSRESL